MVEGRLRWAYFRARHAIFLARQAIAQEVGMATRLIQLSDGTLVEAEVDPQEATEIAGGAAKRVQSSLDRIEPILVSVSRPIAAAWDAMTGFQVERVEVELGLSFEGEGNIFVTKAKAGANLTLTLSLIRRAPDSHE
jgi:hypothetical protein